MNIEHWKTLTNFSEFFRKNLHFVKQPMGLHLGTICFFNVKIRMISKLSQSSNYLTWPKICTTYQSSKISHLFAFSATFFLAGQLLSEEVAPAGSRYYYCLSVVVRQLQLTRFDVSCQLVKRAHVIECRGHEGEVNHGC